MAKKNNTEAATVGTSKASKADSTTGATSNASNTTNRRTKKLRTHALSKMTASEAKKYEGSYFRFNETIPGKEGVIVTVDGLDESEKFIKVKFCIDKTWDVEPTVIEANQFELIELL